jgi:hypothetical protein
MMEKRGIDLKNIEIRYGEEMVVGGTLRAWSRPGGQIFILH